MANEKERVDAYMGTIERMEPEITLVDRDAALASIAISLRRIADALDPWDTDSMAAMVEEKLVDLLGVLKKPSR